MYKRVTSIVISFHLLFMTLLLFNQHKIPVKRNNHVKVRTVSPQSRPMAATVKKTPAATVSKPLPKPTAKTVPKKTTAAKKPVAKPQTPVKKPPTANKPAVVEKGKPLKKAAIKKPEPPKEIWDEIDQALAKIEKKSYSTSKQSLEVPQPLTFLDEQISEVGDDSEISHLMGFLHDTLHLPDVGEVKIQITVRKNGTVDKVVILNAESKKNKDYLQKHLPLLQLPLTFDQDKTWVITFCNEI